MQTEDVSNIYRDLDFKNHFAFRVFCVLYVSMCLKSPQV